MTANVKRYWNQMKFLVTGMKKNSCKRCHHSLFHTQTPEHKNTTPTSAPAHKHSRLTPARQLLVVIVDCALHLQESKALLLCRLAAVSVESVDFRAGVRGYVRAESSLSRRAIVSA